MKNRFFAIILIALIALSFFNLIRSEILTIKIDFTVSLDIVSKSNPVGYGSMDSNTLSVSTIEWPYFKSDAYNLKLQQSFQQTNSRNDPVVFGLIIRLNNTQHILSINNFKDPGRYYGTITCYFAGVQSGNYILTLNLTVNGLAENDFYSLNSIRIP